MKTYRVVKPCLLLVGLLVGPVFGLPAVTWFLFTPKMKHLSFPKQKITSSSGNYISVPLNLTSTAQRAKMN